MNKILIIPARGNSKRLKKKNIKHLCGIPLIGHTIVYAQNYLPQDIQIYVSTEDKAIAEVALSLGVNLIERPEHLSTDTTTTIAVLQHALDVIPKAVKDVILLQATNPLRPTSLLKSALEYYDTQQLESLFTVSPNSHKLGRIQNKRFVPQNYKPGQRSQDLEPWYYENGLLYIASRKLIEAGALITADSYPLVVDHIFGTIDIDTQEDFDYAEFIVQKYKAELPYLKT